MAIRGLKTVLANLEKEIKNIEAAAARGLTKAGNLVKERAQDDVPYDTGALSESAYVDDPSKIGNIIRVDVGFDKEYAEVQHDNLDFFHPVGKALYLEDALILSEREVREIIKREIDTR